MYSGAPLLPRRWICCLIAACLSACAGAPSSDAPLETPALAKSSAPSLFRPQAAKPLLPPAAASTALIAALDDLQTQQNRLNLLAAPLLLNNVDLCKRNARSVVGFIAKAPSGPAEQLQIMTVFPGSGAAQSGLLAGDVLLAIGDGKIAPGPNAERDAARLLDTAIKGHASIGLTVLRAKVPLSVNLLLSRACGFDIELGNTDNINSYTDGRRVMLTRGMLNFVRSDEELAYVLAKEIAHAALTPTARSGMRLMIDKLMPVAAPGAAALRAPVLQAYVPVTDATADKLALYMLVRANYDVANAVSFWQRLAGASIMANGYTALHPATAYRISVIKAVMASIKLKQSNQLPIMP